MSDFEFQASQPTPLGVSLIREGTDLLIQPMTKHATPDIDHGAVLLPPIPADMIDLALAVGRSLWSRKGQTMIQWLTFDLTNRTWAGEVPTQTGGRGWVRPATPESFAMTAPDSVRIAGSVMTGVDLVCLEEIDTIVPRFDGVHFLVDFYCSEWGRLMSFERVAGRTHTTSAEWVTSEGHYRKIIEGIQPRLMGESN